jgi:hypothetical protein
MTTQLNIPSIKLNNGQDFPLVGLGTFRVKNFPLRIKISLKNAFLKENQRINLFISLKKSYSKDFRR